MNPLDLAFLVQPLVGRVPSQFMEGKVWDHWFWFVFYTFQYRFQGISNLHNLISFRYLLNYFGI